MTETNDNADRRPIDADESAPTSVVQVEDAATRDGDVQVPASLPPKEWADAATTAVLDSLPAPASAKAAIEAAQLRAIHEGLDGMLPTPASGQRDVQMRGEFRVFRYVGPRIELDANRGPAKAALKEGALVVEHIVTAGGTLVRDMNGNEFWVMRKELVEANAGEKISAAMFASAQNSLPLICRYEGPGAQKVAADGAVLGRGDLVEVVSVQHEDDGVATVRAGHSEYIVPSTHLVVLPVQPQVVQVKAPLPEGEPDPAPTKTERERMMTWWRKHAPAAYDRPPEAAFIAHAEKQPGRPQRELVLGMAQRRRQTVMSCAGLTAQDSYSLAVAERRLPDPDVGPFAVRVFDVVEPDTSRLTLHGRDGELQELHRGTIDGVPTLLRGTIDAPGVWFKTLDEAIAWCLDGENEASCCTPMSLAEAVLWLEWAKRAIDEEAAGTSSDVQTPAQRIAAAEKHMAGGRRGEVVQVGGAKSQAAELSDTGTVGTQEREKLARATLGAVVQANRQIINAIVPGRASREALALALRCGPGDIDDMESGAVPMVNATRHIELPGLSLLPAPEPAPGYVVVKQPQNPSARRYIGVGTGGVVEAMHPDVVTPFAFHDDADDVASGHAPACVLTVAEARDLWRSPPPKITASGERWAIIDPVAVEVVAVTALSPPAHPDFPPTVWTKALFAAAEFETQDEALNAMSALSLNAKIVPFAQAYQLVGTTWRNALLMGSAIRELREKRGWTIGDLGRALKLTPAEVSAIENGNRLLTPELRTLLDLRGMLPAAPLKPSTTRAPSVDLSALTAAAEAKEDRGDRPLPDVYLARVGQFVRDQRVGSHAPLRGFAAELGFTDVQLAEIERCQRPMTVVEHDAFVARGLLPDENEGPWIIMRPLEHASWTKPRFWWLFREADDDGVVSTSTHWVTDIDSAQRFASPLEARVKADSGYKPAPAIVVTLAQGAVLMACPPPRLPSIDQSPAAVAREAQGRALYGDGEGVPQLTGSDLWVAAPPPEAVEKIRAAKVVVVPDLPMVRADAEWQHLLDMRDQQLSTAMVTLSVLRAAIDDAVGIEAVPDDGTRLDALTKLDPDGHDGTSDRGLVLLALARLGITRPGFVDACKRVAKRIAPADGVDLFDGFTAMSAPVSTEPQAASEEVEELRATAARIRRRQRAAVVRLNAFEAEGLVDEATYLELLSALDPDDGVADEADELVALRQQVNGGDSGLPAKAARWASTLTLAKLWMGTEVADEGGSAVELADAKAEVVGVLNELNALASGGEPVATSSSTED